MLGINRGRRGRTRQVEVRETVAVRELKQTPDEALPWVYRVTAAWAWRFLVLAATLYVLILVVARLRLVVFALIVALLVCALLEPTVRRLSDLGVPRAVAAGITFIGGIAGIVLITWFVVAQFTANFGELTENVESGVDQLRDWLSRGPLQLTDEQITEYVRNFFDTIQQDRGRLAAAGFSTAFVAVEVVSGMLIALFTLFFFLYDGERIWSWLVRLFPGEAKVHVHEAGRLAWGTLTSYIRGTLIVATVDAVFIGAGVAIFGVPLAVPLAALVFIGAFIPLVGATVSGAVAVLVALVSEGVLPALGVLAVIIAVQQLEGHVLQPFILGRAVRVHPLGVVLAVAAGAILAGIGGALVAVPIVAIVNVVGHYFVSVRAAEPPPPLSRS